MKVKNNFAVNIEIEDILRLLGYKDELPVGQILQSIRNEIEKCHQYLKPQVVYEKVNIKSINMSKVELENSVTFEGDYIAGKLKDCQHVIISVSTLGSKIDEVVKSCFDSGEYLWGMIIDNIGILALEYINKAYWKELLNEIKGTDFGITTMLSPGSRGWYIGDQAKIFSTLDTSVIGIELTEGYQMIPLKSTSAVYGFGKGIGITRADHICSECSMKDCGYSMDKNVEVFIEGKGIFYVPKGSNLLEVLKEKGVYIEAPCSGKGTCGKCKVLFKKGMGGPNSQDLRHLSEEEIRKGFRLACSFMINDPVKIEMPQIYEDIVVMTRGEEIQITPEPYVVKKYIVLKEPDIEDQRDDLARVKDELGDDTEVNINLLSKLSKVLRENDFKVTVVLYKDKLIDIEPEDTRDKNFGIALDIGTTTAACYLVNLNSGTVVDIEYGINNQRSCGADVISRINYTMEKKDGLAFLKKSIINQVSDMIHGLCKRNGIRSKHLYNMTVAGNTAMLHMFLGLPCHNIAMYPYIPVATENIEVLGKDIDLPINGYVSILPGISSYVGSDITSGILACKMIEKYEYSLLLDLGTNGEIALGNKDGIITCSTAAGPAFEGANIKCGTGGTKGAISKVDFSQNNIYETIGDLEPCGICGSGILDMVGELIKYGLVDKTGRMLALEEIDDGCRLKDRMKSKEGLKEFVIDNDIVFTQRNVREVQLAKAAVRAGIDILLKEKGISSDDVKEIYIAGGFGSYMNIESAFDIGLLPREFTGKVKSVGNSAGTGARMCLISKAAMEHMKTICKKAVYIELSGKKDFQEHFVDSMMF